MDYFYTSGVKDYTLKLAGEGSNSGYYYYTVKDGIAYPLQTSKIQGHEVKLDGGAVKYQFDSA